jgi:hypothetical protein
LAEMQRRASPLHREPARSGGHDVAFNPVIRAYAERANELIGSFGGAVLGQGGSLVWREKPVCAARDTTLGLCKRIPRLAGQRRLPAAS